MNAEKLQIPRYEMIAEFPDSIINMGDIVTCREGMSLYLTECSKFDVSGFPHLFRKMDWWEKRELHEMPKRVMFVPDTKGDIFEIEEWDMDTLVGWVDKKERSCCYLLDRPSVGGYVPVD